MSLEKPQFNKSESSAEKEYTEMPKQESEEMIGDMGDYIKELKIVLQEREAEFEGLQKNPEVNSERIEKLGVEIDEIKKDIADNWEGFIEDGKKDGSEFLSRDVDKSHKT